jgi:hypothetical protein
MPITQGRVAHIALPSPARSPPGRVHDDGDPGEGDEPADQVVAVGDNAVDAPPPGDGEGDEDAAVSRVHPPEVRGLERGDDLYTKRIKTPAAASQALLRSRSQSQMRYPPPISQRPAATKYASDLMTDMRPPPRYR